MKFSYTKIEEYCNEMHQIAINMKNILEDIDQNTAKIFRDGSWEGTAASYYCNKFSNVSKRFDEVYSEVENSILFLAKTAEGYSSIDKNVIVEICNGLNIPEPTLSTSKFFNF